MGMGAIGRVLVVVHTPRGNNIRLISARKASKGELEQYDA
ncbi:MAG: BrnT family toxin [Paracoccaceae bacterium]